MSMADELGKLERLHTSGALSDAEFAAAKRSLLHPAPRVADDNSLGRAANRYVSLQVVAGAIGLVVFLIIVFAVFLPLINGTTTPTPPSFPGFPEAPDFP